MLNSSFLFIVLLLARGRATLFFIMVAGNERRLAIFWMAQFDMLEEEVGILVGKVAKWTGKRVHHDNSLSVRIFMICFRVLGCIEVTVVHN